MTSFRASLFIFLYALSGGFFLGGCDYARMYQQEYVHTQEALPPRMPEGTVPVSGGFEALKMADPEELKNPLPNGPDSVQQGKFVYENYCIQCHGPRADGLGTVGQSFAPLPTNLSGDPLQEQSDGELFAKILLGFARHPKLYTTVSEQDAWAVVNFIRSIPTRERESARGEG